MAASRILIVEDEFIIAKDIETSLENMGYLVCAIVPSGEEAIAKVEKEKPDLVLMDIILKGQIDGIETARRIISRFEIPIVYLTAYTDENTLERAKTTEPFGYIIKPFNNRELRTAIEMALYKHKMENKFKKTQERYKFLTENMADIVWTIDMNLQITFISSSIEKVLGITPEERKQQSLEDMVTPDSLKRIAETFSRELEAEKTQKDPDRSISIELEHYHKSGTIVWIESKIKAMRAPDGKLIGMYGSSRDITERKKAQDAILQAKKEWEQTFDAVPDLVMLLDKDHRIIRVNKATADRTGIPPEALIGQACYKVVHGATEPPAYCPHNQLLMDRQEHFVEVFEERWGGHFMVTVSPIYNENKEIGSVHVARDITHRKQMETKQEELIADLQGALAEVKTLHGLLPICTSCKKIRDDHGYWNQIESYIQKHSKAVFSHSMCPDCSDKLYGDEDWYKEMKKNKDLKESHQNKRHAF